jgi:hypothetical protein
MVTINAIAFFSEYNFFYVVRYILPKSKEIFLHKK